MNLRELWNQVGGDLRISEHKAIQYIDSNPPKLVFKNDISDNEVTVDRETVGKALNGKFSPEISEFFSVDEAERVIAAFTYFWPYLANTFNE